MTDTAGFAAGLIALGVLIALIFSLARLTVLRTGARRKRIRWAGWAPWWYVGGQPDVPEELQREPDGPR